MCWYPAHRSTATCESAATTREQWMSFVGSLPDTLGAATAAAVRQYEAMVLDEGLKETTVRLCPHCNVQCVRTDGCSTMECGRDASARSARRNRTPVRSLLSILRSPFRFALRMILEFLFGVRFGWTGQVR